jgi:hypothetical protein
MIVLVELYTFYFCESSPRIRLTEKTRYNVLKTMAVVRSYS